MKNQIPKIISIVLTLVCFLNFPWRVEAKENNFIYQGTVTSNLGNYYIQVDGMGKIYFSDMKIDGTQALCLEKHVLRNTSKYQRGEEYTHPINKKVMIGSLDYKTSIESRLSGKDLLVAKVLVQTVAWAYGEGQNLNREQYAKRTADIVMAVVHQKDGGCKSMCNTEHASYQELAYQEFQHLETNITQADTSKSLYYWQASGSQLLLSTAEGKKCDPNKETCEVTDCDPEKETCDTPVTCPPPSQTGVGTCTNTIFEDPEWSCLIGNDTYLDTFDNSKSNPYCSFFCKEVLNSNFPFESLTFQAGQYFTVGNGIRNIWGPIQFEGIRVCRSYYQKNKTWLTGVDASGFITDYNDYVEKIPGTYTAYQNALEEERNVALSGSLGKPADQVEHGNDAGCYFDHQYDKTCANGERTDGNGNCKTVWWSKGKWHQSTYHVGCPEWETDKGSTCFQYREYYTYYPVVTYTVYDTEGTKTEESRGGSCSYPKMVRDVKESKKAYENARDGADLSLKQIRECSRMNTPYHLNPIVHFDYHFDPTYQWSGELQSNAPTPNGSPATFVVSNSNPSAKANDQENACTGNTCKVIRYECTGRYCKKKATGIPAVIPNVNVTSKVTTTTKEVSYQLPSGLYQWVDKMNGFSYQNSLPSNIKHNQSYIDMEESNMPISQYLTPGRYNLSFNYSQVGNIIEGIAHFDTLVSNMNTSYLCPVHIKNDITGKECEWDTKDPDCQEPNPESGTNRMSGFDIIYRPIHLGSEKEVFPSIDGDGRKPGSNWYSVDGSLVRTYITNNRGVNGDEVYELEPLYKITLTPTIMKQIRRYNQKIDDYGDFNLTCEQGTGRKCMSSFIHHSVIVESESFSFQPYFKGKCANISSVDFLFCADKEE